MRIVSGKYKSRRIKPPMNLPVRPTTDFAKESLFNILNNVLEFEGLKVLDLFVGTGSISYEFVSRGVDSVLAVDQNNKCVHFVQSTANQLQMDELSVIQRDVFKFLAKTPAKFDLIFADPPYDLENIKEIYQLVMERDLLNEDGWLIIEHSANTDFSGFPYLEQLRKYGKVHFSLFHKKPNQ